MTERGQSPVNSKGRLFGKNVLEGAFRAAPDEDLFLRELLVAVDEPNGRRYVFRIVDVTYGTGHPDPGWAEPPARPLLTHHPRDDEGPHPLYRPRVRTPAPPHRRARRRRDVWVPPRSEAPPVVAPAPAHLRGPPARQPVTPAHQPGRAPRRRPAHRLRVEPPAGGGPDRARAPL